MDIDIDPIPERPARDLEDFAPRLYQEQLGERSMKRNTIIHLPTGSGKTYIAIMLIKRMKKDLIPPWKAGGKRCIFLVNNVPLVDQQAAVIGRSVPLKVGGFSSENKVDLWKKAKWDEEIAKHHVLVMTSQILVNMLMHDFIKLTDINLIIFDECHHAVEDHPMRQIMKMFEHYPPSDQPRVLGLSATLLNANVKLDGVVRSIESLETTFHATIATVNSMGEVLDYSTNPREIIIPYSEYLQLNNAQTAIGVLMELIEIVKETKFSTMETNTAIRLGPRQQDITKNPKEVNNKVNNIIRDCIKNIETMGLYGGSLSMLAYVILLERYRRGRDTENENLFFKFVISHIQWARAMVEQTMNDVTGLKKIMKYSSEHVHRVFDILEEFDPKKFESEEELQINKSKRPLRAIIFVRQRFTAKILYNILKEAKTHCPEKFEFLKHDFIVGFNINPFNNTREELYEKKVSQCALLKFGGGDINCLISTSVIEEGVDIPQCSLVLRYDLPLEYRSYVQSKGRARNKSSSYVLMVNNSERHSFEAKYRGFQNCERRLQELLVGKEREDPTFQQIEEDLYNDVSLLPFILPSGARITETSAISLLNMYCSILPQDLFTVITPHWILEKFEDGDMQITIYMPINCPVKEPILSLKVSNLKLAKRSAALNACIKLYQAGELDPNTALPKRYASVNFDQEELKKVFLNWDDEPVNNNLPYPGTKKRLRKHPIAYPKCLNGVRKWNFGTKTYHLHIITLKVAFEKPTDSREFALYDLLKMDQCYAMLTLDPLPKLCDFPMFLSVGEVIVRLMVNYGSATFNCEMFEAIKEFQLILFDDILNVAKEFVAFDGKTNATYIVPVTNSGTGGVYDIDWDVINTHKEIEPAVRPEDHVRQKTRVTPDYKYSVVSPWYRGSIIPDRYIVSNILQGTSITTIFCDGRTDTYQEYYSSKYGLNVLGNPNDPLLEVKQINSRMNCLLPRASTLKTLTGKQLRLASAVQGEDKPNSFKECLVAEFCIKYDFPGVLWYKATVLPSILHRINMLLMANDLRMEIATATNLGSVVLDPRKNWAPISMSVDIATESLLASCDPAARSDGKGLSMDRINNRGDAQSTSPPPRRITTMKDSLFKLQLKKLAKQYPWDENKEPMDIERNLTTATLMDIECYDEFMTAVVDSSSNQTKSPKSPSEPNISNASAICPPPLRYNDKINLLSPKQTLNSIELRDILTALTTIKSHDSFNLERTETLGDSFLKFAATLYLFHKFPALNEGQLTNIKGRLIGNRNLFYAGRRVNLGGRMKVEGFSPRSDFVMPAFSVPQPIVDIITAASIRPTFLIGIKLSRAERLSGCVEPATVEAALQKLEYGTSAGLVENETEAGMQAHMQHHLGFQLVADKMVADCVESLVGVHLLGAGLAGGIRILEWLRVLPPQDNFMSYLTRRTPTALTEKRTTERDIDFLLDHNRKEVEQILNYTFKDPSILLEALSHPSYSQNRVTRSYERLEFLGDAVLDFLITAHVFERNVALKPGELTDLRSALVNNVTFACYIVKLGLNKFLMTQINPSLERAVSTFVQHQEQRNHNISEDVLYLIDEADCKMAQYVEVPKILSDLFESLAGAIYLDTGGDLQRVWSVFYAIMYREIDSFSRDIPKQPVRLLHERIHAIPHFGEVRRVSPDIPEYMAPVTLTVNGRVLTVHGFGANRRQAMRAAAKLALTNLDGAAR